MEVIAGERRGILKGEELEAEWQRLGYAPERRDRLRRIAEFFPTPQDLVMWQAREVYEPDAVEKYGLDDEFDRLDLSDFAGAGVTEGQARNYWRAHWQHPSWGQVIEMMRRTDITEADVEEWYRLVEIPPYWRDRFTKISYNPLTRVDVRRMYRIGVMDAFGVFTSYVEGGYNPNYGDHVHDTPQEAYACDDCRENSHAGIMLRFTIRYESGEDRGLTRASVIKAFKMELLTPQELPEYLQRLDYPPDVVDFWVEMAHYEKAQEDVDDLVSEHIDRYRLGEITLDTVHGELVKHDLPASYVDAIIRKEQLAASKRRKMPSKSELTDWLTAQIIDEDTYVTRMGMLGYLPDDIITYLEEIALIGDTEARKYLSITVYQRWLTKGLIDERRFTETAAAMDVEEDDIITLIAEALESRNA